jgi:circadian clock protein KaiB
MRLEWKDSAMDDATTKEPTVELEQIVENLKQGTYLLRLYVTGMTPRSLRAIENIKIICQEHLEGRYELEIIDIYQQPELAKDRQIIAAPTLIKELPPPLRRFIGDLSDKEKILIRLDLVPQKENG